MLDRPRQTADQFYNSPEWLRLRYKVLTQHKGGCSCCGMRGTPENPLQVDHIKARSVFPGLALDINNMQVLCRACNLGKSNREFTDWRWQPSRELCMLETADKEHRAKLQQLGWLKEYGDGRQIRQEAAKEYRKLWREIELAWIAKGQPA